MSTIIAGRFDTFARAETIASRLMAKGVRQDDLTMFYVNPPGQHATYPIGGDVAADPAAIRAGLGAGRGMLIGALVGFALGVCVATVARAILGSGATPAQPWVLMLVMVFATGLGAYAGSLMGALGETDRRPGPVRQAGVLLAAHVSGNNSALVAKELRQGGADDVELAEGQWRNGRWEDFDPLAPPVPAAR